MTALYHRRSAQTHLVAEPVPQILAVLDGTGVPVDDILVRLALDDTPDARLALVARLDEMCALGLVTRE